MKKLTGIAAMIVLLTSLVLSTGCGPRMARHMVGAALVGAAIAGTAVVLAHHDAHYHHVNCGCHREWHDGRWTYYYDSAWEYRDPHTGTWYRYDE